MVIQTLVTSFPEGERNCHSPALFHHQPSRLKSRLIFQLGQDVGCVNARKLLHLLLTDGFADDHPRVHTNYFLLFLARLAMSESLNLSYCSGVRS